jgi:hypothetical protein
MNHHQPMKNALKTKILILLLALAPWLTRAQNALTYATNNGAITITGHVGSSSGVTNVVIPDIINGYPVTSIGGSAFYGCESLTSVAIGNSVTNIGDEAFADCTSLTNIAVAADNPAYRSVNDVLFDKKQTTLIQFPGGDAGSSYTIPGSVTNLGDEAFAGCANLTSITMPDSVTTIGISVFQDDTSLTNLTLSASVTSLDYFAIADCTSLTSITIPNSVTNIGFGVFQGDISLTSVIIPDSVTSIGFEAFADCTSVTSITIPASVTSIGDEAFWFDPGLTNLTFLGNAPASDGQLANISGTVVYYYYGTSGWGTTYDSLPTVELFAPQIGGGNVSVQSGQFSFTVTGVTNQTIVIEASANLVNWQPVWTNTLSGTNATFTDPQWKNYPARFYRAR